jgi:hypothetical protein
MRKSSAKWWLGLEALVPIILLLAILFVLLWLAVVLWPYLMTRREDVVAAMRGGRAWKPLVSALTIEIKYTPTSHLRPTPPQ